MFRFGSLSVVLVVLLIAGACKGGGGAGGTIQSAIGYDEDAGRLLLVLNRNLKNKESLHVRVRALADGDTLACGQMASQIATFDERRDTGLYVGPVATASQFENPTSPNTLLGETPATSKENPQKSPSTR